MKVIELKDVKKSYGKNEILHGISLDIEEGSIHGLVGRNGCGKTTLIKCLTGIYEQDQGQILVCGEEILRESKSKSTGRICCGQQPCILKGIISMRW